MSHPYIMYYLAVAEMEDARRDARKAAASTRTRRLRRTASEAPREVEAVEADAVEERIPTLV